MGAGRSRSSTSTPTATPTSTSPTASEGSQQPPLSQPRRRHVRGRRRARRASPTLNQPGTGVSMGIGLGRLRQRRLRGPARSTSGAGRSCSTTTAARRSRASPSSAGPAGLGQHQRRGLARLRPRRPARPVPRRLLRRDRSTSGTSPTTKMMPESFEYAQERRPQVPVPQPRRRPLRGGQRAASASARGAGRSAAVAADLRGTGYPDLFIANDYGVSELFVNEGGTLPRGRQARPASATRPRAA